MSNERIEYIQDDGQLRVFIVPVDILDVPDLTSSEKLVYIVLRSYVNPTDPTAFPAYKTIAAKASLSRRRVIDIIKSLEEKGLIRKEARFTVTKERKIRDTSNTYTLITPKKAKPSEIIAPPPVKSLHPPGETIAPYHNHLTKPLLKDDDLARTRATLFSEFVETGLLTESEFEDKLQHITKYETSDKLAYGRKAMFNYVKEAIEARTAVLKELEDAKSQLAATTSQEAIKTPQKQSQSKTKGNNRNKPIIPMIQDTPTTAVTLEELEEMRKVAKKLDGGGFING